MELAAVTPVGSFYNIVVNGGTVYIWSILDLPTYHYRGLSQSASLPRALDFVHFSQTAHFFTL